MQFDAGTKISVAIMYALGYSRRLEHHSWSFPDELKQLLMVEGVGEFASEEDEIYF